MLFYWRGSRPRGRGGSSCPGLRGHVNGVAQSPVQYESARQETGAGSFRMASGELPETDVIRGAQAGDERMYRELVSRYVRPALAVAWEFTDTLDDAEDLVQEAFRRVVDALHRFEAGRPFAPWFFTIL